MTNWAYLQAAVCKKIALSVFDKLQNKEYMVQAALFGG